MLLRNWIDWGKGRWRFFVTSLPWYARMLPVKPKQMRKSIKNYTSGARIDLTVQRIQKILSRAGAKRITFEYKDDSKLKSVAFSVDTPKGEIPVALPARVEKVAQVMYGTTNLNQSRREQAERTAWKNIQDWIDAQMALVETEMVKIEEVFLPYMTNSDGRTFFEVMEDQAFLLPSGNSARDMPVDID